MIVLPFAATNPNLKVLYPDPVIDKGTIFHWKPSKSGLSNYANGNIIPDLASWYSKQLLGITDETLLSSALSIPAFPTEFVVEKTPKGAIHFMVTQNTLAGGNRRANLPLSAPVRNYIDTNNTHRFCVYFVGRITRRATTTERPFFLFSTGSYTASYYFAMRSNPVTPASNNSLPNANATYQPSREPAIDTPFLFAVEVTAKTGTWDINGATALSGFMAGITGAATAGGHPSLMMYYSGASDLTVSGKAYSAKVNELLADFTQKFSEGGEYYGDSWTNPVSVLP